MTDRASNQFMDTGRSDFAEVVEYADHFGKIFERPIKVAKPVRVLTQDMQADIAHAGGLAMARLRKSLDTPADRMRVLNAIDGLEPNQRNGQYNAWMQSNFDGILTGDIQDGGTLSPQFRPPAFVAALPVPARELRQLSGSNISALPERLASAVLIDGNRVLLSANLGLREHYIAAQVSVTIHLISYLSKNYVEDKTPGQLARVYSAMFGEDPKDAAQRADVDTLPMGDVLDQGSIKKARLLHLT